MADVRTDEIAAARDVAWTAQLFLLGTSDKRALAIAVERWQQCRERLSRTAFRRTPGGSAGMTGDGASQSKVAKQPRGNPGTPVNTEEGVGETEATSETGKTEAGNPTKGEGGKRTTWLTPYGQLWREHYGGEPIWGQLARSLNSARETLGDDELLRRWKNYLTATPGRFASPARFAATVGEWANAQGVRDPLDPRPGEDVDAYIRRVGR